MTATDTTAQAVAGDRFREALAVQVPAPAIVLVRHGETEWTRDGRHTSHTNIPLTAQGEEQARTVRDALAGRRFGLVLTSPCDRATQTAAIAGFPNAETDADLSEWNYGAYEGLSTSEISTANGGDWDLWRDGVKPTSTGSGEQSSDVLRRTRAIISRARVCLNSGEDVLLFSHGHYLRALAATWISAPIRMGSAFVLDTASISTLGFEHDNQVIRQWNRPPWCETYRDQTPTR
jgi:probable phosphoglycerate mutase